MAGLRPSYRGYRKRGVEGDTRWDGQGAGWARRSVAFGFRLEAVADHQVEPVPAGLGPAPAEVGGTEGCLGPEEDRPAVAERVPGDRVLPGVDVAGLEGRAHIQSPGKGSEAEPCELVVEAETEDAALVADQLVVAEARETAEAAGDGGGIERRRPREVRRNVGEGRERVPPEGQELTPSQPDEGPVRVAAHRFEVAIDVERPEGALGGEHGTVTRVDGEGSADS